MPIHDWTLVEAGIFHAFHHRWISAISDTLNLGLLPDDHYALPEQITGGFGPDVVTLQSPPSLTAQTTTRTGAVELLTRPPKVKVRQQLPEDIYAGKADSVVIRHSTNHRVVAVIEIVSPGNKNSKHGVKAFVDKIHELLRAKIHLLVLDLIPVGPRDPGGVHGLVWQKLYDEAFLLPEDQPLSLVAYRADRSPEAFIEPTAVGQVLVDMPIFIDAHEYISVPLESTYLTAWNAVPAYWRNVISQST